VSESRPIDLVVVGGGVAGLSGALRAAELGLAVLVLEQGADPLYACNSRYTGGAYHVGYMDVARPTEDIHAALRPRVSGHASPRLVERLCSEAMAGVRWLQSHGVRFIKGPVEYQHWLLAPPRANRAGLHWRWRAGDTLLRTLETRLDACGGSIRRGVLAERLLIRDGRVEGVVARIGERSASFDASAVLIADGGFQANSDLLRAHVCRDPGALVQRGAATGLGRGLAMAIEAGAMADGLEHFYGHVLSREADRNPALWPWPTLDGLAVAGAVLDGDGRRFVDESLGGVAIANHLARLPDPSKAWVVFDDQVWQVAGTQGFIPPNPFLVRAGGSIIEATTLASLAERLAVREDLLVESLGEMTRGGSRWMAIPAAAGITYTMGGIVIDEQARVLRRCCGAIPGLWAAGSTTAGIEGGDNSIYVGGLAKSVVTGLAAAESIHNHRQRGSN
jgi:fumarate reductase flavoprotein subunit